MIPIELVGEVLDRFTLDELALSGAPLTASAASRPCEMYRDHGSAFASITQGHHVFPVYMQNRVYGRVKHAELIWLCGTCHDNTHAWLYFLLGERREPVPHPPARAKALALRAHDWYLEAQGENSG